MVSPVKIRPHVLTHFLWIVVPASVLFSKPLQCYSGPSHCVFLPEANLKLKCSEFLWCWFWCMHSACTILGGRLRTSYLDLKYSFFSSFLSEIFSFWFSGLSLTVLCSAKSGLQPPGSPPRVPSCTVYLHSVPEGRKELVSLLALTSHRTKGVSRDSRSRTGCSLVGRASGPESSQALLVWDRGVGRAPSPGSAA